jgi:hypothetical protein
MMMQGRHQKDPFACPLKISHLHDQSPTKTNPKHQNNPTTRLSLNPNNSK